MKAREELVKILDGAEGGAVNFVRGRELKEQLRNQCEIIFDKLYVSLDKAREIMDLGLDEWRSNVLGPDTIEKTFGFKLDEQDIPRIPFSEEELEIAWKLGQFLVLRVDKTPKKEPLTMLKMDEIVSKKCEETGKGGKVLYDQDIDWVMKSDFYTKETPRKGWALTSISVLEESTDKNYHAQTQYLADYIQNEIYQSKEMPSEYIEALKEWEVKKEGLKKLMGEDWKRAVKELGQLRINQLTRRTPVEILLDDLLYSEQNGEYLLNNRYDWTWCLNSGGEMVAVGDFDGDGLDLDYHELKDSFSYLGVCLSRRSD